jgi:hypothetical protein
MDFWFSNTPCSYMPTNYHATSFFEHSVEMIHTACSNHRCTWSKEQTGAGMQVTTECTRPNIPSLPRFHTF